MLTDSVVAISFDADGTLFDFNRAMRLALEVSLDGLRRHYPKAAAMLTTESLVQHRNAVAQELRGTVASMEDIRLAGFKRTLAHAGIVDDRLAVQLTDLYLDCRFTKITTFDDVQPALKALATQYMLGVLSNGNSYPERCGLDGWFSFGIYAHDHGFEKPDRRMFDLMVTKASCDPSQILHVGDSLQNDVLGAKQAGIRAIWLNRTGETNQTSIFPDYEISSLTEIPGICGR